MGILEDVYLRIPGGEFAGIQVSLGFIDDFLSGREFIVSEEVGNFGVNSVLLYNKNKDGDFIVRLSIMWK